MRRGGVLGIIVAIATASFVAACDETEEAAPVAAQTPPPAVTVAPVTSEPITPTASFNGRVEAVDTVDLRARVEGFLEGRHFTEGQQVKQGDLLFTIEDAQYQAAVAGAEAEVARTQAALDNAELELRRAEELYKNRNIAEATVDQRRTERDTAMAQLAAAEANLRVAQLNLGYTRITAPIDGRIGTSAYSQGNLVNPSSGVLATIVSQDPIYVTFPVSSRQLLEVRKEAQERGEDVRAVRVRVRLPDGTIYEHAGAINFVDNQVDPNTDTVTVRASLPNPDRLLIDGQLVGVIVESEQPFEALVIPQAALLNDQGGSYVLIVGAEDKAEQRRVQLGQQTGTKVVVQSGLAEGDRVIVEGLQQVRPGQPVQVDDAGPRPGA